MHRRRGRVETKPNKGRTRKGKENNIFFVAFLLSSKKHSTSPFVRKIRKEVSGEHINTLICAHVAISTHLVLLCDTRGEIDRYHRVYYLFGHSGEGKKHFPLF